MDKKGRDKKAEVEKYPRLEPKEFETIAKDKAEAGEIVRLEDEKVEAESPILWAAQFQICQPANIFTCFIFQNILVIVKLLYPILNIN